MGKGIKEELKIASLLPIYLGLVLSIFYIIKLKRPLIISMAFFILAFLIVPITVNIINVLLSLLPKKVLMVFSLILSASIITLLIMQKWFIILWLICLWLLVGIVGDIIHLHKQKSKN